VSLSCVASVSVGFSARHFLLFGGAKIGASATLMEGPIFAPIFARSKSEKCFKPAESPTETLATQPIVSPPLLTDVFVCVQ